MNVFLTGATGYIGSAVAEALTREGHEVLALARSGASERRLKEQGYRVQRGDLEDAASLTTGARAADAVIHAGAAGGERMAAADETAVEALLDALKGTQKPFVYTSGIWVLGDTGQEAAGEEAPANPTPLVEWRVGHEDAVLAASDEDVGGVVVRPGIVYGRGGGIPAMMKEWGRKRGAVPYLEAGANRWPVVHVDDLAELYVRALDAPAGTTVHAAAARPITMRQVAEALSLSLGLDVASWPLAEAREKLGGFADALALDQQITSRRARRLFGWTPTRPNILDEIVRGSYAPQPSVRTDHYVCQTCGTQHAATEGPPERCLICDDERQFVPHGGQQWTTMADLRQTHRNIVRTLEPGLTEIYTKPRFAIGQRALLVETPEGSVLWDCITLLDDRTTEAVNARGGLDAIVISHPHYYAAAVTWSRTFGDAPIYVHAADQAHIMRPDEAWRPWHDETLELPGGLTAIRTGGHFDGSTVLHWPQGAGGRGVLLTGDTLKVTSDRRYVSFMYSYPNHVPLAADDVRRIAEAASTFSFDRLYGAWHGHTIHTDAERAVQRSRDRYIAALEGHY